MSQIMKLGTRKVIGELYAQASLDTFKKKKPHAYNGK